MENSESIHAFWFGDERSDAAVAQAQSSLWWGHENKVDEEIKRRFEAYVLQAGRHELDAWLQAPLGRLALIVLTDQFPRNIYRGTPQAFAFDAQARAWAREGLQLRAYRSLRPIERVFFYLPFEHSESLHDQEYAVALFSVLVEEVETDLKSAFEGFLDFAIAHYDIIKRFGRFPHRNAILGRASSAEEEAFLAAGHSFS